MNPLLVAPALTAAAPGGKDKAAAPPLEGEWTVVSATFGGEFAPQHGETRYRFGPGDRVEVDLLPPRKEVPPLVGMYKLNAAEDPAEIDIKVDGNPPATGPGTLYGIVKADGDELTLCYVDRGPAAGRPKKFEATAASPGFLLVFKRVKAKD